MAVCEGCGSAERSVHRRTLEEIARLLNTITPVYNIVIGEGSEDVITTPYGRIGFSVALQAWVVAD